MTSAITTSGIDPTKPAAGTPTTASVRGNFSSIVTQLTTAASEITALQTSVSATDVSTITATSSSPTLTVTQNGAGTALAVNGGNITSGPSSAALRLNGESSATAFVEKTGTTSGQIEFGYIPSDGTGTATVRLFRNTNTTGNVLLSVTKGNNSSTTNHALYGNNSQTSALCSDNGNLRLGNSSGSVYVGSGALATTATTGFLWIPSCPGSPTGAPTAPYTNASALVTDTTNSRLYALVGATWKYAALV